MARARFTWDLGRKRLRLGERTLVMGVVNVTPDSFSDGGQFLAREAAVEHALRLLDEGADLLDIGGESTRPGARAGTKDAAVSAEEELRRILPVLEAVRRERSDTILSVDTYKAEVARAVLAAGADAINDISALQWDPAMAETLAGASCGVILMHTRGRPDEWRALPPLADPVATVARELEERATAAVETGIAPERIVLDPGFGFGKSFEENYPLLARFADFAELGFPLLAGTSRKSFLGRTLATGGKDAPPEERLFATVASVAIAALHGAHIVRVHDVRAAVDAVKVADAVLAAAAGSQ